MMLTRHDPVSLVPARRAPGRGAEDGPWPETSCPECGKPQIGLWAGELDRCGRTKLFIGSIASETTENDIVALFRPFGEIKEVKILMDKGRPKFSAFVNMRRSCEAHRAVQGLNHSTTLPGARRILEVRLAERSLKHQRTRSDDAQADSPSTRATHSPVVSNRRCVSFDEETLEGAEDQKELFDVICSSVLLSLPVQVEFRDCSPILHWAILCSVDQEEVLAVDGCTRVVFADSQKAQWATSLIHACLVSLALEFFGSFFCTRNV